MRLPLLAFLAAGLLVGDPARLTAQGLRDKIGVLFIFGPGQYPLFPAGAADPDNPESVQAHGTHFVPSSAAENASVIAFVIDAIGGSEQRGPEPGGSIRRVPVSGNERTLPRSVVARLGGAGVSAATARRWREPPAARRGCAGAGR
jgi:hypothetical protein